jgi:hypothetical protein
MWLLIVYIVVVIVGDVIAYAIGSVVEGMFTPAVGLPVFLAMFFAVFWLGWLLAIRLTAKWDVQG